LNLGPILVCGEHVRLVPLVGGRKPETNKTGAHLLKRFKIVINTA